MISSKKQIDDICLLPKVIGNCKALFQRFYFDQLTNTCLELNYGGCGGNKNNFSTLAECQNTCITEDISIDVSLN